MVLVPKLIRFLLLVVPMAAAAQSKLPPCPADEKAYRHNCFGSVAYAKGDTYVGEFKDDNRNGQGTFTYANGNKYVGEWKDSMHNGEGMYTFANGNKYVGEFKDGNYHGEGTYTFANGDKYVGEWKNGMHHGQGIEYLRDGRVYRSGRWVNHDLAQSIALDKSRFPFDRQSQAAVPPVDPGRAERDRLAAEADAAKRRQQELEQRLATEARE